MRARPSAAILEAVSEPALSRVRTGVRVWGTRVLAAFGAFALVLLVAGVIGDYRSFDRTSGGYEPPYTNWTGTPIDWEEVDRTADGFRLNGRVLSYRLDCTSGTITFELYGLSFDYRTVSERAIAVHRPREACREQGFSPEF